MPISPTPLALSHSLFLYPIRPLSGPIRDDCTSVCFVFYRERSRHIHTTIHVLAHKKGYTLCAVSGSRDRKIRLRKTVDFLPRERVTCRRKGRGGNGQLGHAATKDAVLTRRPRDSRMRTGARAKTIWKQRSSKKYLGEPSYYLCPLFSPFICRYITVQEVGI